MSIRERDREVDQDESGGRELEPNRGLEVAEVGEFGVLLLTVTTPVKAAKESEGLPP